MMMVSNKSPLEISNQKTLDEINKNKGLYKFLELFFRREPHERPEVDELLNDPFFEIEEELLMNNLDMMIGE